MLRSLGQRWLPIATRGLCSDVQRDAVFYAIAEERVLELNLAVAFVAAARAEYDESNTGWALNRHNLADVL